MGYPGNTMLHETIYWNSPKIFKYIIGEAFWEGGNIVPIVCSSYIFYGIFISEIPNIRNFPFLWDFLVEKSHKNGKFCIWGMIFMIFLFSLMFISRNPP